jgi:acetylornithine deacetylase
MSTSTSRATPRCKEVSVGRGANRPDELVVTGASPATTSAQALERLDREKLPRRVHPLLGRASLHCSLISGGTERSTYPDRCSLDIERRTLPGDMPTVLRDEVEAILSGLRADSPDFAGNFAPLFDRLPLEVPGDAPIICALDEAAATVLGATPRHEATAGWTDA